MTEGTELRRALIAQCHQFVDERSAAIRDSLQRIEVAKASETKSSAGDKFETGRAMMQMEERKLSAQMEQLGELRQTLAGIRERNTSDRIGLGSLVATNRGLYFLAIGAGKLKVAGRTVFCTSLTAPIGGHLHGKRVGDSFLFNEVDFEVLGVV